MSWSILARSAPGHPRAVAAELGAHPGLRHLARSQAAQRHRGCPRNTASNMAGCKRCLLGGLTSINHPRLHETMISGPIGGILGAAYVGKLIGNDSPTASIGRTSFDMGVSRAARRNRERAADGSLQAQCADAASRHDRCRRRHVLKVDPLTRKSRLGPECAGSDPGPICFAKGGTEPTIADCDAILGRRNPHYFLGGKVHPDREGPRRVQGKMRRPARRVGGGSGQGMIEMLESDANNALRRVISGQGIHPSEFTLLSTAVQVPCTWPAAQEASASRTSSPSSLPRHFPPSAARRRTSCAGIRLDAARYPVQASDDALQRLARNHCNVERRTKLAVVEMIADGHRR